MSNEKKYSLNTKAVHAGFTKDPGSNARGVPVHRSAAFYFDTSEHAANLFALKEMGNIYSRIMNPTQNALEERVAALEGGAAALALASGTSAIFYTIITICKAGDEVVAMNNLYGGTYTMFKDILPQFGIKVHLVSQDNEDEIRSAINDKTKILYAESVGNPALGIVDIKKLAAIANDFHIPLAIDSTFTTPVLVRPLEHGAHIVIHSLTKWLGGHGTGIGGIVVDGGTFDWTDPKFDLFNEPDPSYHGLRFAHDLGEMNPVAFILRMRLVPLRNLGACISPDNAWMFLQGIETLPLRMERHCSNALKIAEFLESSPHVDWVKYPGLKSHPDHEVAKNQFSDGYGGMVVFGVKGGYDRAVKLIDSIDIFAHLANVGDVRSLILHPSSTSHQQLSEENQKSAGLTPDLIRLSIGIEDAEDLITALEEALEASK